MIDIYTDSQSLIDMFNTKLSITFSKVKAHSGNKFNEKVDKLISTAYGDLNLMINLKTDNMENLLVIPRWKNITIDKNIRSFIKSLSNTQGFEQFFNQNRNSKKNERKEYIQECDQHAKY
ncbi:hypothetical protein C1645_828959 [Glomus cerebriforme]|uniref:RNase H type-1 domain-containing protein n=1 Tax=Glomus cerebriforme TaxID=658196 RepID=A0A397SLW3_9GLOM|nr:hypothetical protein C1645_828959 [Glomus cerebriforme]